MLEEQAKILSRGSIGHKCNNQARVSTKYSVALRAEGNVHICLPPSGIIRRYDMYIFVFSFYTFKTDGIVTIANKMQMNKNICLKKHNLMVSPVQCSRVNMELQRVKVNGNAMLCVIIRLSALTHK